MAIPPEFDERSNWGLKPLRHTFIPPYFKDWHRNLAAPGMFGSADLLGGNDLLAAITSSKQKCKSTFGWF